MSVAAERPLIGNDEEADTNQFTKQDDQPGFMDSDKLRPKTSGMSVGFRFESPANDAIDDEFDGPIIRRIDRPTHSARATHEGPAKRTPRLFSQHLNDNTFLPLDETDAMVPAMQNSLLGDMNPRSAYDDYRIEPDGFSVAAIRAKRMKKSSRNYGKTGLIAKTLAVGAIGAVCVISGVTLGLYGSEIGYQVERRAQMASASLSSIWPWSSTDRDTNQLDLTPPSPQESPGKPTDNTPQEGAAATGTVGKKLFYSRILPSDSTDKDASAQELQTPRKLSGLDQHLAVPNDLLLPTTPQRIAVPGQ